MSSTNETDQTQGARRHTAGWFDVRNIIGTLLAIYGIVLLIMGVANYSGADRSKTQGVNLNLWTGIGMLIVGGLMVLWAITRPIVVDEVQLERDKAREELERPGHTE